MRAFAHPAAIDYLKKLGVTAVELLPVHDFLREKHLLDKGLTNYWGYNTRNFFSPTSLYSSSGDRGRAGDGVQEYGEGAASRWAGGDSGRGL